MEHDFEALRAEIDSLKERVSALESGKRIKKPAEKRPLVWDIDPKRFITYTGNDDDKVLFVYIVQRYRTCLGTHTTKTLAMLLKQRGVKQKRTSVGSMYLGVKLV